MRPESFCIWSFQNHPGVPTTASTQCTMDSFVVTSPGGRSSDVICGFNSGEHSERQRTDRCNIFQALRPNPYWFFSLLEHVFSYTNSIWWCSPCISLYGFATNKEKGNSEAKFLLIPSSLDISCLVMYVKRILMPSFSSQFVVPSLFECTLTQGGTDAATTSSSSWAVWLQGQRERRECGQSR